MLTACVCCQDGAGAENKSRRRIGRWREEETTKLINLTKTYGRGKWKLILEKGGLLFANRTQVRAHSLA